MTTVPPDGRVATPATGDGICLLVAFILVGVAVSVALGVYGRVLEPSGGVLTTLGFWTLMSMKVTLGTAAMVLCVVQIITALRIFETHRTGTRLPRCRCDTPDFWSHGRAVLCAGCVPLPLVARVRHL